MSNIVQTFIQALFYIILLKKPTKNDGSFKINTQKVFKPLLEIAVIKFQANFYYLLNVVLITIKV